MARLGAAVAVLLATVVLAACGGGGDDSSSDESTGAEGTSSTAAEPVDLTLWVGFTNRELQVIKDAVKEYDDANPNVTVKVVGGINDDKIIASLRGGDAPDAASTVHVVERRQLLLVGRLHRPAAVSRRQRRRHGQLHRGHAVLHAVQRHALRAADPGRRLRAVLQQEALRRGRPDRAAEDDLGADRVRQEADQEEPGRVAQGRRLQPRGGVLLRTPPATWPRCSVRSGPTTRASPRSPPTRAGRSGWSGRSGSSTGTATTTWSSSRRAGRRVLGLATRSRWASSR